MKNMISERFRNYWPLFVLIAVSALAACALNMKMLLGPSGWMHYFMGISLCIFAMLKLFNIGKFAEGFRMYDLLAEKDKRYGYVYPFLELMLGLGYLSFSINWLVNILAIILFGFSAAGVIISMKKGLKVNCACMGNVLQVPLSIVTLTEDIVMVMMAVYMLFFN